MNDCGLIPYVTKSPVVDLAGLSNRNIALSGDHHAAAVAEVSRSRPDLVLLVASRINDSTSVLGMESLSDDDLRSLGYRLAGSIEAAPSYHYLVYATAAPPVQLVLARMKSDGSMTTA